MIPEEKIEHINSHLGNIQRDVEKIIREKYYYEIRIRAIKKAVAQQAEDEGLWFIAQTASEAYLQQELRKLHEIIESEFGKT